MVETFVISILLDMWDKFSKNQFHGKNKTINSESKTCYLSRKTIFQNLQLKNLKIIERAEFHHHFAILLQFWLPQILSS